MVKRSHYNFFDIRITQVKKAFANIPQLLVSNIDLEIRKKLLKTYIWNVVLYGCEAWTISPSNRAFIMNDL